MGFDGRPKIASEHRGLGPAAKPEPPATGVLPRKDNGRTLGSARARSQLQRREGSKEPSVLYAGRESGQATKGARWMPWHQGPKKGVARLRKASDSCQASSPEDTRMGQPGVGYATSRRAEHIGPYEGTGGTETS